MAKWAGVTMDQAVNLIRPQSALGRSKTTRGILPPISEVPSSAVQHIFIRRFLLLTLGESEDPDAMRRLCHRQLHSGRKMAQNPADKTLNLLVLGASGGCGQWLIRLAQERGHHVRALVRPATPFKRRPEPCRSARISACSAASFDDFPHFPERQLPRLHRHL